MPCSHLGSGLGLTRTHQLCQNFPPWRLHRRVLRLFQYSLGPRSCAWWYWNHVPNCWNLELHHNLDQNILPLLTIQGGVQPNVDTLVDTKRCIATHVYHEANYAVAFWVFVSFAQVWSLLPSFEQILSVCDGRKRTTQHETGQRPHDPHLAEVVHDPSKVRHSHPVKTGSSHPFFSQKNDKGNHSHIPCVGLVYFPTYLPWNQPFM